MGATFNQCELNKIILVDDHALFREGIKLLIEMEQIGRVVAEAANGKSFLELLNNHSPDLAILDIDMPVMDGLEATRKALAQMPDLKILVLSMHGNQEYYSDFVDAGVKGFTLKTAGKTELETAIRTILAGNTYFSQELLLKIISDLNTANRQVNVTDVYDITDRELETLRWLGKGLSIPDIAGQMFLSPKTIEAYRSKLLLKTETKNTLALVLFAIKNKLITEF